jgi:integrase
MYLIYNRHGQPYTPSGFKSMWKRIMNEWVKAGNEHFTFHDIRAKSTTDLKEDGRTASELTGHLTERIAARVYDRRVVRKAKAVR